MAGCVVSEFIRIYRRQQRNSSFSVARLVRFYCRAADSETSEEISQRPCLRTRESKHVYFKLEYNR